MFCPNLRCKWAQSFLSTMSHPSPSAPPSKFKVSQCSVFAIERTKVHPDCHTAVPSVTVNLNWSNMVSFESSTLRTCLETQRVSFRCAGMPQNPQNNRIQTLPSPTLSSSLNTGKQRHQSVPYCNLVMWRSPRSWQSQRASWEVCSEIMQVWLHMAMPAIITNVDTIHLILHSSLPWHIWYIFICAPQLNNFNSICWFASCSFSFLRFNLHIYPAPTLCCICSFYS